MEQPAWHNEMRAKVIMDKYTWECEKKYLDWLLHSIFCFKKTLQNANIQQKNNSLKAQNA